MIDIRKKSSYNIAVYGDCGVFGVNQQEGSLTKYGDGENDKDNRFD